MKFNCKKKFIAKKKNSPHYSQFKRKTSKILALTEFQVCGELKTFLLVPKPYNTTKFFSFGTF